MKKILVPKIANSAIGTTGAPVCPSAPASKAGLRNCQGVCVGEPTYSSIKGQKRL